jgi:hypothetical protein
MNLQSARQLRDEIKLTGICCVVPLGRGPASYFARIWSVVYSESCQPVDFYSREDWLKYVSSKPAISKPRSPLEAMIDRACGITDYK